MGLKEILGEAYTEELEAALNKHIGENFVSRRDFNAKNDELKTTRAELDGLKANGGDLQKQYDALKAESEAAKKAAEDRFNGYRLRAELGKAKAKDPDILLRMIDQASLDFSDEKEIKGLADAVKAYQKSHPYLFDIEAPATGTGAPASSSTGAAGGASTIPAVL